MTVWRKLKARSLPRLDQSAAACAAPAPIDLRVSQMNGISARISQVKMRKSSVVARR